MDPHTQIHPQLALRVGCSLAGPERIKEILRQEEEDSDFYSLWEADPPVRLLP